jgi:KaiC/GvpD/RAD55 family RecA-like ATPase
MKSLSKKTVCYITLSKTFDSLKEQFGKKKIKTDNVVFIDAISKSFKKMPDQTNGCYYVSSPSSLTELEIAALKVLRHGFNYLVFDSLSAMLVYQKNAPAARFVSALSNNARQNNAKAIFYAAKSEEQSQMIKDVGAVVDKVIDLGK